MLRFSRRFGQPQATLAGMEAASGDAVVVIDCDLQDPPELIADMVARWREGYDVVYAQRRTREGETLAKRIVSAVGYRVIERIADVDIPTNTGDFRLMSRRVVDHVVALDEAHGFLRGLVGLVGFRQTSIALRPRPARRRQQQVQPLPRLAGDRAQRDRRLLALPAAPDLASAASCSRASRSCSASPTSVLKLAGVPFPVGNPTIVFLICLFSGIQLLSLGDHGRVRRAHLRRGQAAAEVHHRVRHGIEARRAERATRRVSAPGSSRVIATQ